MSTPGRHRAPTAHLTVRQRWFIASLYLREWLTVAAPDVREMFDPAAGLAATVILLSLLPGPAVDLLHWVAGTIALLVLVLAAILIMDTVLR